MSGRLVTLHLSWYVLSLVLQKFSYCRSRWQYWENPKGYFECTRVWEFALGSPMIWRLGSVVLQLQAAFRLLFVMVSRVVVALRVDRNRPARHTTRYWDHGQWLGSSTSTVQELLGEDRTLLTSEPVEVSWRVACSQLSCSLSVCIVLTFEVLPTVFSHDLPGYILNNSGSGRWTGQNRRHEVIVAFPIHDRNTDILLRCLRNFSVDE